jgi:hypothetical protein
VVEAAGDGTSGAVVVAVSDGAGGVAVVAAGNSTGRAAVETVGNGAGGAAGDGSGGDGNGGSGCRPGGDGSYRLGRLWRRRPLSYRHCVIHTNKGSGGCFCRKTGCLQGLKCQKNRRKDNELFQSFS